MKNVNFILFVLVAFITCNPADLFSQDWPQWRGIDRNSRVTGFSVPSQWPAELTQEWKVSVGTGDATPILEGNKLYVNTRQGSDEVLLCLDAATGREIWKSKYPCIEVTGPSSSHPGPRSTPAIANGKVVTFGVSAILSCYDASTGKVLWRRENPTNAVPTFFAAMSPLIVDNLCIAHIGKKDDGEVLALDLNTGKEIWKWAGDGPSYSSPSVMIIGGKKHVIVQTEKNLISLDLADGKLLWKIPTPVQQRFYNSVSPYIDGQTIYITGQGSGMKSVKIEKKGNDFLPVELWNNSEVGAKWNTPVLKNGYLYGFTDQKRMYCLDASTGKTKWINNDVSSDFATIVDCGSVLMGLPSTATLIVLKPDFESYSDIKQYKVSGTAIYAFPVIAGNNIYIKDAESLTLFRIK